MKMKKLFVIAIMALSANFVTIAQHHGKHHKGEHNELRKEFHESLSDDQKAQLEHQKENLL